MPTVEERLTGLEKKIDEQEQNWKKLKWAVGLLGTAVVLVTGVGFVQIPRAAAQKAIDEVKPIATEAAKKEVEKLVPQTITAELQGYRDRAATAAREAEDSNKIVKSIETDLSNKNVLTPIRQDIAKLQSSIQSSTSIKFNVSEHVTLDEDATAGVYIVTYSLKEQGQHNCTDLVIISPKDPDAHPHNPPQILSACYRDPANSQQIKEVGYALRAGKNEKGEKTGKWTLIAQVHTFNSDAQKQVGFARYIRLPTPR